MLNTSQALHFQEQSISYRTWIPEFGTDKKRNEATLDSANFSFCNSDIQQPDKYLDDTLNIKQLEMERGLFKLTQASLPKISDLLKQSWSRIKLSSQSRKTFNNIEIDTIAEQKIIPYINQHFLCRTVSTKSCRYRASSPRLLNRSSIRKSQENKRKFRLGVKLERIQQFLMVRKSFNAIKSHRAPSIDCSRQSSSYFARNRSLQIKIIAKYCRRSIVLHAFWMIKQSRRQKSQPKCQEAISLFHKVVSQKIIKHLYHAILKMSVYQPRSTEQFQVKQQHYVELNCSLPIECIGIQMPIPGSRPFTRQTLSLPLKARPKDLECSYLGQEFMVMFDRKLQQI